jgi:hypothetical protein
MQIKVSISSNRNMLGQLSLYDITGLIAAGPYWVLARADYAYAKSKGNDGADPLKVYGNTPTGTYSVVRIEPCGDDAPSLNSSRSYGVNGALVLVPTAGDALAAKENGGRTGLLAHGGDLSPSTPGNTLLRSTHGCIRMANADVATLTKVLNTSGVVFPFDLLVAEDFDGTPPDIVIGDDPSPDDTPDPPPCF